MHRGRHENNLLCSAFSDVTGDHHSPAIRANNRELNDCRLSDSSTLWPRSVNNPRLTGGGGRLTPPPSRIFAIAQKRTELSTWNLAGLLIQQFDIVRGIVFEIRRKTFEIWSILWRHYTPLLVDNWPNFAGLWKTQFLIKTQMKNTKRRRMRCSTRWLSRFVKILGFWPLKFQKINFLENDP